MSPLLPELIFNHHGQSLFPLMNQWQSSQKLPSVILLTGQAGIGKRKIAQVMAQWMLCETQGFLSLPSRDCASHTASLKNTTRPMPCTQCPSCLRVASSSDSEFIEISAQDAEDASSEGTSSALKIETFRKLKSSQGFAAHPGRLKVILIASAERMTAQAANSVLKLLEEPPMGWVFLLTAADPTLLLPTIASRCQNFRLKPFSTAQLEELLSVTDLDPERRAVCASLAQGSWDRACLLAEEHVWEKRKLLFEFLKTPSAVIHPLIDWASAESANQEILLDLLEQIVADLLKWSVSPFLSSPENYPWSVLGQGERSQPLEKTTQALISHARKQSQGQTGLLKARKYWLEHAERLAQARLRASLPLNKKLFIQHLLMPWLLEAA
ncbi:MAG: hypothetical protein ACO3A2_05275 [Bdellovibrionia bacterium]